MCRYGKCDIKSRCCQCSYSQKKWGIMVCSRYNTVINTDELRKNVLDRVEEMTRIQNENASLLSNIDQAKAERKLPEEDKVLCELWEEYNSLKLDLKMYLDECLITDFDREQLYKYFDVSEKIKEVMK